ncbi:MAG: hypothetical protein WCI18_05950 [Pseudomonadota bacterium]
MIASVTELNLKNFLCYLKFIPHAIRSHKQARLSNGLISISTKSNGLLVQRTLTVWKDEASMLRFVRSGPHLAAMKVFGKLADQSYTFHFEVSAHPTWEESLEQLRKHARQVRTYS